MLFRSVLTGDLTVMRPLDSLGPRSVASGELGRLLVNRATGLALSRLAFEAGDDEAVRGARHVAKAALALGDALLVTVDQYPATLRARLEVLQRLAKVGAPFVRQIETAYAQAIAFREAPTEARVFLPALEQACLHLWGPFASMEAHRLGTPAATPMDYAEARGARFPELSDVSALGRTLGGLRGALTHTVPWRASRWHPRESLARAAVVLAFEAHRRRSYEEARRWLRVSESTPQGLRNALERLRDIAS